MVENHLQGGLVLELGMRIDGDAPAVVAHGDEAVLVQFDLDPVGLARHRLVHGVVQKLGHQVMHGPLVGAADVHAGAPADRLQPLQDLDVLGRVVAVAFRVAGKQVCHGRGIMGMGCRGNKLDAV